MYVWCTVHAPPRHVFIWAGRVARTATHVPGVLHLGQVKEWAEAGTLAGMEGSVVVEEVEAEVDEAADGRLAVDEDVRLGEVPAAGSDEELGGSVVELVLPPARRVAEGDGASHGVPQVDLPVH